MQDGPPIWPQIGRTSAQVDADCLVPVCNLEIDEVRGRQRDSCALDAHVDAAKLLARLGDIALGRSLDTDISCKSRCPLCDIATDRVGESLDGGRERFGREIHQDDSAGVGREESLMHAGLGQARQRRCMKLCQPTLAVAKPIPLAAPCVAAHAVRCGGFRQSRATGDGEQLERTVTMQTWSVNASLLIPP